jgi:hypothetical protein
MLGLLSQKAGHCKYTRLGQVFYPLPTHEVIDLKNMSLSAGLSGLGLSLGQAGTPNPLLSMGPMGPMAMASGLGLAMPGMQGMAPGLPGVGLPGLPNLSGMNALGEKGAAPVKGRVKQLKLGKQRLICSCGHTLICRVHQYVGFVPIIVSSHCTQQHFRHALLSTCMVSSIPDKHAGLSPPALTGVADI